MRETPIGSTATKRGGEGGDVQALCGTSGERKREERKTLEKQKTAAVSHGS
ncbi:MAG: hypothetical protein IJF27_00295 [Oscillospiraceae bacterium]|nr:hypothetical protein [Oscillospiraceae bacterium]